MPQSALDKWNKMANEITKVEVSLFKYEVPKWVAGEVGYYDK